VRQSVRTQNFTFSIAAKFSESPCIVVAFKFLPKFATIFGLSCPGLLTRTPIQEVQKKGAAIEKVDPRSSLAPPAPYGLRNRGFHPYIYPLISISIHGAKILTKPELIYHFR
jgi:hypothetical protein